MTNRQRIDYLEGAILDRERRIFSLAGLIRAMSKANFDPLKATVDYSITQEEAKALGIFDYQGAVAYRQTAG
jgi:hypothetical protein